MKDTFSGNRKVLAQGFCCKPLLLSVFTFCSMLSCAFLVGCQDTLSNRNAVSRKVKKLALDCHDPSKRDKSLKELLVMANGNYNFGATKAVVALGTIGDDARTVVPDIAKLMRSPNPFVAREAARSLGKLGSVSESAIPDLEYIVAHEPRSGVAMFAAESLEKIGKAAISSLPVLRRKHEELSAANRKSGRDHDLFEESLKSAIRELEKWDGENTDK